MSQERQDEGVRTAPESMQLDVIPGPGRTLRELSPEFQRVTGIYTSSLHANDDYSKADRETTPGIQMTERKIRCQVTTGSDTSGETRPHEATALQPGTEKSLLDGQWPPQVERTQKILLSCLCQPPTRA